MLTHLRTHLAFGHAVRTGEVELESIDTSILDHADQLLPASLFVFLHDRGDQNVVWILLLDLSKLVEPHVDWPIGDQFDVFESDHLTRGSRAEFSITRNNVDDLRGFETDSLSNSAAPTCVVRLCENAGIRSRRPRTEQKRVRKLHAVDGY